MNQTKQIIRRKWPLLLIILCVVGFTIIGVVYSKFITDEAQNASLAITAKGELTITVSEPQDNRYTITNSSASNMPAYIRCTVVVNLQDSNGNLWASPAAMENTEYTVIADDCTKLGDYFYYNGTRNPGDSFTITVTPGTLPNGYTLHVQILAEGMQSIPTTAVTAAWHATFETGSWVQAN